MAIHPINPAAGAVPTALYVNEADAAALLSVSPRTLQTFRQRGTGPKFQKIGRRVTYRITDLQEYMDQHTYGSTSEHQVRKDTR